MTIFLIGFFTLYSLLHLYFLTKLRLLIRFNSPSLLFVLSFLILMILSPLLVHILQRGGLRTASIFLHHLGYSWMGFVFLFFSLGIILDLLSGISSLLLKKTLLPSGKFSFIVPAVLSICLWIYGYFEAKTPDVERISINSGENLRIVLISDLHLGPTTDKGFIEDVVKIIKELKPHILFAVGDLLDGELSEIQEFVLLLREIEAPLGKYAVTGNHEYYVGIDKSLRILEYSGFRVLRNEVVEVSAVTVVGFDEVLSDRELEYRVLKDLSGKNFIIVLKHRPIVYPENLGLFDIQLSGHTHGGQILPFRLITRVFFRHTSGFHRLSERSSIFVSRGVGTWGPKIRVFSPPEIALIELRKNP